MPFNPHSTYEVPGGHSSQFTLCQLTGSTQRCSIGARIPPNPCLSSLCDVKKNQCVTSQGSSPEISPGATHWYQVFAWTAQRMVADLVALHTTGE